MPFKRSIELEGTVEEAAKVKLLKTAIAKDVDTEELHFVATLSPLEEDGGNVVVSLSLADLEQIRGFAERAKARGVLTK